MLSVVRTVPCTPLRTTDRVHEDEDMRKAYAFDEKKKRHGADRHDEGHRLPTVFESGTRAQKYRRLTSLGSGGFSVCYLFDMPDGKVAAGKIFSTGKACARKRLKRFEREVNIMQSLDHPNIVKCLGAISGVRHNKTLGDFSDDDDIEFIQPPIMFLEYCAGGSLSSLLKMRLNKRRFPDYRYGQLTVPETLWVAESTCRALEYIQSHRIIHRDIKMGNLLLQSKVDYRSDLVASQVGIVMCDFGLSTQLDEDNTPKKSSVGTPAYMAPEVVAHRGASYPSDMWSLGVTLFHCLTGRGPFDAKRVSGTYRRIKEGTYRWSTAERENLPSNVRHLIDGMLARNPSKRPTPSQVLSTIKDL